MSVVKQLAAALICSVICLSFSCCSDNTPPEQEYSPPPDFQPLNEIVEGRKNIYFIVKNLDSSYWNVMIDGAKDGGTDFGCNVYYSGTYAETEWQAHEQLLNDAVALGADAILLAPNDSVKLSGKIDEVYSKGIPIVLLDTIANTDSYDVCYMTDNLMAGQQAAEEMMGLLKKSGVSDTEHIQIGMQVGAASSQTISERLAGFIQYWSRHAPEAWEIIPDIKCNDGYLEKAIVCAEELLEYPNLRGVFGTNNSSTIGFAQIIKEHGRKDIAVVGFDYSAEMAELINDDEYMASTMLQRQYYMSYTGIETALKLLDGEKTPVKFVDTGVIAVNKDTIDQPEVQEALLHN